jgi:hypothetical protein
MTLTAVLGSGREGHVRAVLDSSHGNKTGTCFLGGEHYSIRGCFVHCHAYESQTKFRRAGIDWCTSYAMTAACGKPTSANKPLPWSSCCWHVQVSGLKYSFVATGPAGQRVLAATVLAADGSYKEIDPCKNYWVATNDYVTGGCSPASYLGFIPKHTHPAIATQA